VFGALLHFGFLHMNFSGVTPAPVAAAATP
jgi:hypothetical protein